MEQLYFHSKILKNVTPTIKLEHITNKKLVMSASEMFFLINNLSFFVGDLVPCTSKAWKLYISLRKLVSFIMSPSFTNSMIDNLEKQVEVHHKLYKKLSKQALIPKHHHLLHYVRMLKMLPDYQSFQSELTDNLKNDYVPISWISIKRTTYAPNMVIIKKKDDSEIVFKEIVHVYYNDYSKNVVLLCKRLKTINYSNHFCAY